MLSLAVLSVLSASPVEGLPVVGHLDAPGGTRVTIRGALSKARARQLVTLAAEVQGDVTRRFLTATDKSVLPPVELCLFERSADYDAFVAQLLEGARSLSPLGFFDPARRVVVANVGLSVGNLRHELAHALLHDDWPDIPAWLTEGVGALYGTAALERGGFRFLPNYRLRHLRAARKAGTLPTLSQLARSTADEVYGARVLEFYALARASLLYLDAHGTLRATFDALRGATTADARERVLLGAVQADAFFTWTDGLVLR
ncbi:MAG: hypothetical protein JNJ54_08170 [Myxococcaceae bacterium]|nr:hypothetical protein [Myxococcaceae bacterium]